MQITTKNVIENKYGQSVFVSLLNFLKDINSICSSVARSTSLFELYPRHSCHSNRSHRPMFAVMSDAETPNMITITGGVNVIQFPMPLQTRSYI